MCGEWSTHASDCVLGVAVDDDDGVLERDDGGGVTGGDCEDRYRAVWEVVEGGLRTEQSTLAIQFLGEAGGEDAETTGMMAERSSG